MNSVIEQFRERGFVHLRNDAPVSQERLVALASQFGKLMEVDKHHLDYRCVQEISNSGYFGTAEVDWHNDGSASRGEFHGTLLYNHKNGHLAETWFCDMEQAYAALPQVERRRLRDLRGHYAPPQDLIDTYITPRELRLLRRSRVSRPLVFDHPLIGRPVLYFSPATLEFVTNGFGTRIEFDTESLVRHCENIEWRHDWIEYDILIYDNTRFMHKRSTFQGGRVLYRVQFSTTRPAPHAFAMPEGMNHAV